MFTESASSSVAVFEKEITNRTRADCLIFTPEGIIGIEIKTAHDSKERLDHQIKDYLKVCYKVYILVHNEMLYEATEIVEQYPQVGIVAYTETDSKLFPGVIREARVNSQCNLVKYGYNLLWSYEYKKIAQGMAKKLGETLKVTRKASFMKYISYHKKLSLVICSAYIRGDFHPDHNIIRYKVLP